MKLCFKCRREKPLTEFYRHPRMGDGHLGKCKDCTRTDVRSNRLSRRTYYSHYDMVRYQENPSRQRRVNEYAALHPARCAAFRTKWDVKNPKAKRAHAMVRNAVRSGVLKRLPCERCGSAGRVHGHHHLGYNHPLVVTWLCPRCHERAHNKRLDMYLSAKEEK